MKTVTTGEAKTKLNFKIIAGFLETDQNRTSRWVSYIGLSLGVLMLLASVQMYLNDIFTVAGNLTGTPGIAIPCGFDRRGLPIGVQIQANYFNEAKLLNVAHQFQQATDWHARAPKGIAA